MKPAPWITCRQWQQAQIWFSGKENWVTLSLCYLCKPRTKEFSQIVLGSSHIEPKASLTHKEEVFLCWSFHNPTQLSAKAEAFWASPGGAPRTSGQEFRKPCGDRTWGRLWNKWNTKRKRLVPTPDVTAIWRHVWSRWVQENASKMVHGPWAASHTDHDRHYLKLPHSGTEGPSFVCATDPFQHQIDVSNV